MNLTDEQKDLLRLLVSQHELHHQAEFLLVRSQTGAGLVYAGDRLSVPVEYDDSDFQQLRGQNLITLARVRTNVQRGKPAQRGITFVQRNFAPSSIEQGPIVQKPRPSARDEAQSGTMSVQRIAEGSMSHSGFWKDRQAEFEMYAKQFASLEADWKAAHRVWLLRWGSTPDCFNVPQECKDVFNAIARKFAAGLSGPDVTGETEPWQLWLDYMREKKWGFRPTGGPIACTEQEWDAGVEHGKSLAEVRREQNYTTGDEWKNVYERTKGGTLRRLSEEEVKGKSSEELQKYYHWLQDGTIERIFETSALFCEDLTAWRLRNGSGNIAAHFRLQFLAANRPRNFGGPRFLA